VRWLVAEPEVDMVHLDFTQAVCRAPSGPVTAAAAPLGVWPARRRRFGEEVLKPTLTGMKVSDDLGGRASRTVFYLLCPLCTAPFVLREILA
jgi:hypothetical protein